MTESETAPGDFHFHGGVILEGHKSMSSETPVRPAPLPKTVLLPIRQHIGDAAELIVKVGDKVARGQKVAHASSYISAPIHASTSGTVIAIEERPVPHPSGLSMLCIEIEADGEDRWLANLPNPVTDYTALDAMTLRGLIRDAGIVGLGGAAFPTAVKLNPPHVDAIETLVINGIECEPYISCDDRLMREHASEILQGIAIIQHMIHPGQTLIGIEDNKPEAISALRAALQASPLADSRIIVIPTLYPSGGERQLIKILTGKEIPSGRLPIESGIVCQNVGTAYAIYTAIIKGEPLIERIVTVTGKGVAHPQNLWIRMGTPFSAAIAAAGGYENNVQRLIMGGSMMGIALKTDAVPVTKSTNCILCADESEAVDSGPAAPCIRCGACVEACPAQLLPQQLFWYAHARDFDKIQEYSLFDCIECGCCAQVCPSHIPLVQYYRFAKTEIWQLERAQAKADVARDRHEFRQERLELQAKEKAERLARKRAALKKSKTSGDDPKKAAIQAALARAKAKKAAQQATPANIDKQTASQQKPTEAADARRTQPADSD